MSEKKRKRGRPRVAPLFSYGAEIKMRSNSNTRTIKKPKYLKEQDDDSNISRSSTPGRSVDNSSNHSRSSLNGGKSKNPRGYNPSVDDKDSEYHYGSDFDMENESDIEKKVNFPEFDSRSTSDHSSDVGDSELDEFGDGLSEQDGGGSEIGSTFVPFWKLGPAGTLGYRASTPVPVWLQDRDFSNLELPKSSDDILIPRPFVLPVVGIYEVLRHFRNLVRLSPFHFEDFCVSLLIEEHSVLLSEIFIALLKAIIREDDSQQTHFGLLDQKDSTNISLYFIDSLTWMETLRQYLYCEPSFKPILDILNSCNFPYTSLANRIKVLQFLCDQFLQTSIVRDFLIREGKIRYDDSCRACHKTGDLLCCDSCSAVYHLECANPPLTKAAAEMEDWTCSICNLHKLDGVTDCLSLMEASGLMSRQEPLGYDRHGRKYWFLVRRIFVESENGDLHYYSTVEHFNLLISLIDRGDLEESLYFAFKEFSDDIRRQMEITKKLTDKARGTKMAQIDLEANETKVQLEEVKNSKSKIVDSNTLLEKIKDDDNIKNELTQNEDLVKNEVKEENLENLKDENLLKKEEDQETKGKDVKPLIYDDDKIKELTQIKERQLHYLSNGLPFRLGCDNNYRNYCNHFATNLLALNKLQHNEERDKRRHLSHKFSLTNGTEFKWCGITHGSKEGQISTVRQTLLSLEQNLSTHFFHPNWHHYRKLWNTAVSTATTPKQFARTMMMLVSGIKPLIFSPVWYDGLGHVRLKRLTALEREERKKQEKREKKEADDESKLFPFVKYTKPIKHQLWKMKGEEYRMHGLWGWQWLSAFRKVIYEDMSKVGLRAGPDKVTLPIKGSGSAIKGLTINGDMFKKFLSQNPSFKTSILSPKQLKEESDKDDTTGIKEIFIKNSGTQQRFEIEVIDLEDHFEDGLINVSKALNSRTRVVYPKLTKGSMLDSLLTRRLSLKLKEEREIANRVVKRKEETDDPVDVVNDTDSTLTDDSDSENIEELPDSLRVSGVVQGPTGNLLREMRNHKLRYEALDKVDECFPCYSPLCRGRGRSSCYSPSCLLKERTKQKLINSVNSYKIVSSKPAPFDTVGSFSPIRLRNVEKSSKRKKAKGNKVNGEVSGNKEESQLKADVTKALFDEDSSHSQSSNMSESKKDDKRIYSSEQCSGKIYLKKSNETKRTKRTTTKLPQICSFKVASRDQLKNTILKPQYSIFHLPPFELRIMARRAGRYYPNGFSPSAKGNHFIWPYPSYRPNFKVTWLYRTVSLPNISAAAYQLRILWACLRWEDMNEKGPIDGRKQITTDMEIIQTEILKRKCSGRYLEKTEYLRRKVIIPLDVPKTVREFTPSQRSGLRKRKRALSPVNKQPESVEEWIEEEKLDLWEVRSFGERLEKATQQNKKSLSSQDRENNFSILHTNSTSSPSEFKAKIEEQMKLQRASFNQKKNMEGAGIIKVAIGSAVPNSTASKAGNKMIIEGLNVGSKLPSILPGRKIVTTKGGRIITVQTAGTSTTSHNIPQKFSIGKNSTVFPVSSLPKVQVTSQGNKVIKLQNLTQGNTRAILPRANVGSISPISTSVIRPITPNTLVTNNQGITTSSTNVRPTTTGQPIQLVRLPDGQLQVKGLQNGQQLIQKSDGKIHLLSTKTPLQATTSQNAIQIAQQMKTVSGIKDFTIKGGSPLSTGQIVKINGQQMILRASGPNGKQLVSVNSNEVAENKVGSLTPSSPQFKSIKSTDILGVKPLTAVSPSSHSVSSASSLLKKPIVADQQKSPLSSPTKGNTTTLTLRVQVKMTEQGPKTIIQGLQPGIGLTKDHIMAIQHQVRSMLTQYNLQVNQLSPLMTLTLHMTNRTSTSSPQQTVVSQPLQVSQAGKSPKLTPKSSPIKGMANDLNDPNFANKIVGGKSIPVANNVMIGGSPIHSSQDANPKEPFVVTSDYIQQTIKSALNKNDLSPDVEEKLVQLQKFTNDKDTVVEKPENLPKRGTKRRGKIDENQPEDPTPKPKAKKAKIEKTRPVKKEVVVSSSKVEQQEMKKKVLKQQKLDALLAKHKDSLKKDVLKKRALLEKELQIQIHKELAIAKKHLQIMEKIKSAETTPSPTSMHSARKKSETVNKLNQSGTKETASRKKTMTTPPAPSYNCTPVSVSPTSAKAASKTTTPLSKTKKGNKGKNKKIVCICRTPFDDTKFYVGCDLCGNWFHGDCVGITEALSRTLSEYVCDDCANAKLNKDLFCFCRQPYDESQFYICCERCEDWYHGKCIGIMQTEADDIDDYICPKCDPNNQWNRPCQKKLTSKEYTELKKVAKALIQHKNAWPFLEPVDQTEVPDYYKVVKEPMDLKSIDQKVTKQKYENLAKFVADVMLVFDNCRAYNPPNSSFCSCAQTLELFFCQRLRQLKQKFSQKS